MNPTKSEGVLLVELYEIQYQCRQGLLSGEELIGFIRIVHEIESCIARERISWRSLRKGSNDRTPVDDLVLSCARLSASTRVSSYQIKGTRKDSAYSGPYTYVNFSSKNGFELGREESRSGWSELDVDPDASDRQVCRFVITNTNGVYFGGILEHLKEVVYWSSLRFSYDELNKCTLRFVCKPEGGAKYFGATKLQLATKPTDDSKG